MHTYLSNLIPTLKKFSQKLDDVSILTSKQWVVIDEVNNIKTVYIFRPENLLLISVNGRVSRGVWDYLGHDTLLIDIASDTLLFRHGFLDDSILVLKIDNAEQYAYLVAETVYENQLKNKSQIDNYLTKKYLTTTTSQTITTTTNYPTNKAPTQPNQTTQHSVVSNKSNNSFQDNFLTVIFLIGAILLTFFTGKVLLILPNFSAIFDRDNIPYAIFFVTGICLTVSMFKSLFED